MKSTIKRNINKYLRWVKKNPFKAITINLVALLSLIVAVNLFTAPPEEESVTESKQVISELYSVGQSPTFYTNATLESSRFTTVIAQSSGIIQSINVGSGANISRGQQLVSISTTYSGASAPALQSQLAKTQYQTAKDNYQPQIDQLNIQAELIEQSQENSQLLRQISRDSLRDTRQQLNLSESILATITQNLEALEAADIPNPDLILSSKQLQNQLLASVNQLRSAARNLELQSDSDKPPGQLSKLELEISQSQLDLRRKSLDVELEIARLQRDLAYIQAALMAPQAPFYGIVEQVHVRLGQAVNPGTPLVTISGSGGEYSATSFVPTHIASKLSPGNTVSSSDISSSFIITHVSIEPTRNGLHAVSLSLSPGNSPAELKEGRVINIALSVGLPDTGSTTPFIPIDAVHQTTTDTIVFVNSDGTAQAKSITLGPIIGSLVQIESGLISGDQIILNRQTVSGDKIKTE